MTVKIEGCLNHVSTAQAFKVWKAGNKAVQHKKNAVQFKLRMIMSEWQAYAKANKAQRLQTQRKDHKLVEVVEWLRTRKA